jgi:hypothetical protein
MADRADGDADIPEMRDIRIQFFDTEINTFPAHGTHPGNNATIH